MSRILPLSQVAISQISSSKQITTLQGVCLALLENSLDAGASKVEVNVDFGRGGCTVEDDGTGIPLAEFDADGGLGHMHHTSKFDRKDRECELHGRSGTYLASLAALSLLSITSRHEDHHHHATIVLHHGNVVARHIPAPQSHELITAVGTRATVRDLFGNTPVRVKQRVATEASSSETERAWLELKRGIAALLLAWPKSCAVRLSDVNNTPRTAFFGRTAIDAALTEKTLNVMGGKAMKRDVRDGLPMLCQAGLSTHESRHNWVPVSADAADMSVKGAMCLVPAPTKHCQFLSIGIYPCASGTGQHDLYDAINHVVANSSFGSIDDDNQADEAEKLRRKHDRRYKNDGYTQKQLQGRKGVDRWPMFVLQLRLKDRRSHHVVAESTSEASLKAMIDLLEAMTTQWLAAHHFRPQKLRRRRNEEQTAPMVATSSPMRTPNNDSSGIDVLGKASPSRRFLKRPATTGSAITPKKGKFIDVSVTLDPPVAGGVRPSNSAYFNGLSRIKSGRGRFFDDPDEPRHSATAPSGQSGTATSTITPSKHPFKLIPIEAGHLSVPSLAEKSTQKLSNGTVSRAVANTAPSTEIGSSDDYGSIDDEALIETIGRVDGARGSAEDSRGRSEVDNTSVPAEIISDDLLTWTDPTTKQIYRVNARTGVVLPMRTSHKELDGESCSAHDMTSSRHKAAINTSTSSTGQALSLAHRHESTTTDPQWIRGFLRDWKNPVFQRQEEERIPVASFEGPGIDLAEAGQRRCADHALTQHFAETGDKSASKLSKAALNRVKVIRQVDDKFILCSMPSSSADSDRNTLVLVDQHAASERVMLEGLLKELCTAIDASGPLASYTASTGCRSAVITTMLDRAQRYLISEQEYELFAKHAQHFADWGILYDPSLTAGISTSSQVREAPSEHRIIVRTLPPGIAERCTLLPHLLIELLRSEIWSITRSPLRPPAPTPSDSADVHAWLQRIGSCPKGILEMLNSRACRSAIMFNDVLSVRQCEELLADLSRCAFPFMCAHGRQVVTDMSSEKQVVADISSEKEVVVHHPAGLEYASSPSTTSPSPVDSPPSYDSLHRERSAASSSSSFSIGPDTNTLPPRPEDRSSVSQLLRWMPTTRRTISEKRPRLHRPVLIPQLDVPPVGESVPFQRCYSNILAAHDVPVHEFVAFLDGLSVAQAPTPVLQSVSNAGRGVRLVPLPFADAAGRAISALASTGSGKSGSRARLYLIRASQEYFAPRGLRVSIVKDDELAARTLHMSSDEPRLAPLTAETLTDTVCMRRLRAVRPYAAELTWDVPQSNSEVGMADKLARKHLRYLMGRNAKDVARLRDAQMLPGGKACDGALEEQKLCSRLRWLVVEEMR
ncbi:DNA mismatch repair protein [Elasticomyces elasticus]|nr:DNA mismatch repair protein [Elasticomyces elasticus]KAK4924175.1 DNA mismatch repair protein [Elasticomyces elasticus]KAK5758523.1 DNA mismatch repair protein [Elasticomyces elasticus]